MKNKTILFIILIIFSIVSNAQKQYEWLFPDIDIVSPHSFGGFENNSEFHTGIDIIAPAGTDVICMCDGIAYKVLASPPFPYYEFWIDCFTGERMYYAHMNMIEIPVAHGQTVYAGITPLGIVEYDDEYSHIHLEIEKFDLSINPYTSDYFPTDDLPEGENQAPEFGAFYIKNKTTDEYEKRYVYGTVDIIREARDNMEDWYDEGKIDNDPHVFSGKKRHKGATGTPYKLRLEIPNSSYSATEHIYKEIREVHFPQSIEIFDVNLDAGVANNPYYYCRILTNSFISNDDPTHATGYDYEENPWQTRLKNRNSR